MHSLHNANILHKILPRDLYQLPPICADRIHLHKELASQLQKEHGDQPKEGEEGEQEDEEDRENDFNHSEEMTEGMDLDIAQNFLSTQITQEDMELQH